MLTAAHAAARMSGIGSSDIADIVLRSGLRTYLEKTGQSVRAEPATLQGFQPLLHGTRLEAYVCDLYAEETGAFLVKPDPPVYELAGTIARASPDRIASWGTGTECLLEAKTANRWLEPEWELVDEDAPDEAGVPEKYVLQCEWQMGVTGYTRCDTAVLLGGQDFRIRHLPAHPARFEALLAIAERFWTTYVEPRRQPPADGSDEWKEYLARKWPRAVERKVLDPSSADFENADRARRYARVEAWAEGKKETHRARLKVACADAEGIRGVCSYANTKKGRVLRLAKEK